MARHRPGAVGRRPFREERYAALALARHRLHREHRQAAHARPLRAPDPDGRLVGPRRRDGHHLVRELLLAHPDEVAPVSGSGRSPMTCGYDARPSSARSARRTGATSHCWPRPSRPTWTARPGRHAPVSPYGREFFIRKAIGWALRDHARTDPDWVLAFVDATEDAAGRALAARGAQAPTVVRACRNSAVDVADPRRGASSELPVAETEHLVEHAVLVAVARCRPRRCASHPRAPTAATRRRSRRCSRTPSSSVRSATPARCC